MEHLQRSYWSAYSGARRDKKQDRFKHNQAILDKQLPYSKYMSYIEQGKILQFRQPGMDRVLFFMASNRWSYQSLDYYGDLNDCVKFINKRAKVKLVTPESGE